MNKIIIILICQHGHLDMKSLTIAALVSVEELDNVEDAPIPISFRGVDNHPQMLLVLGLMFLALIEPSIY